MMAASVVRSGIAGTSIDPSPTIPSSQHSSSMHDSPISTPSSGPSTTSFNSPEVNSNEEQEEGRLGSNDHISFVSPAGKKLAVPSVQGPAASLLSPNSLLLHEDETDIALSQLKELEVAIEVRKVTRVDGRKTRWIEYRREKQVDSKVKEKSKSRANSNRKKLLKRSTQLKNVKKPAKKTAKKTSPGKASPVKASKGIVTISDLNGETLKRNKLHEKLITNNNNNNIDNNNKNKIENSMKVEVVGSIISSLGTNNVLETMKQQFMQGTVDIPRHAANGLKEKTSRKIPKSANGISSYHINNELFKRKPGRPRKLKNLNTSKTNTNTTVKTEPSLPSATFKLITAPALSRSTDNITSICKKLEINSIGQSTADFYSRRNFLTKGLREVRKSESGSESGGSSPIKDGSPSNMSPSPQLSLGPIPPLAPLVSEHYSSISNSLKCPLITTAVRVVTANTKKPKATYGLAAKKKKILKKMSKKENINVTLEANGPKSLQNGSTKQSKSEHKKINSKSVSSLKKKGRGRKPKRKVGEMPLKWAKKTTVIVDVHNTMNGEPQTVIPVQNPILRKKKSSPSKTLKSSAASEEKNRPKDALLDSPKLSSNKQKDFVPVVPQVPHTSSLLERSSSPSFTSRKLSNSQSASKVNQSQESGKIHSTNIICNSDDIVLKNKDVPETLKSINSLEVQNCVSAKTEDVKDIEIKIVENKSPVLPVQKSKMDDQQVKEESTTTTVSNDITVLKQTNKSPDKTNRNKEVKQTVTKKSQGNANSTGEEGPKKPNTYEKKQKSIQDYIEGAPKDNSKKSTNLKENIENEDNIEKNVEKLKASNETRNSEKEGVLPPISSSPANTTSSVSITNSSEPSSTVKPLQPCTASVTKASVTNKSPKKTPEKIKSKSLNAVLEKLYSPTNKNAVIEKTQEPELHKSASKEDVPVATLEKEKAIEAPSSSNIEEKPADVVPLSDKSTSHNVNNESQLERKEELVEEQLQTENKSVVKPAQTANPNNEKVLPAVNGSKPKEKVPRFLKQLFQDEGVQIMLRSVNEEAISNVDGISVTESGPHKLRPKRANENVTSDSPEPDDALFLHNSKRKKRGTEVDYLFLDEGTLNLLTSLDTNSRRPSLVDDNASDSSLGSGSKGVKESTKQRVQTEPLAPSEPTRKRKLSDNSSNQPSCGISNTLNKVPTQEKEKDAKKPKLDTVVDNEPKPVEVPNVPNKENDELENKNVDKNKKKPGRPSLPVPQKQKTKAQVAFHLKKQLHNLGIPSENLSISQMKELITKSKETPNKDSNIKTIPPIKIKLPPGQEKESIPKPQNTPNTSEKVGSVPNRVGNLQSNPTTTATSERVTPNVVKVTNVTAADNVRSIPTQKAKTYSGPNPGATKPPLKHPASVSLPPPRKVSFAPNSSYPQITSLVRSLEPPSSTHKGKLRTGEAVRHSQRTSVRQSEANYHFRDIALRRFNNFMQIILTPSTTKMKNSLNSRVLRELCEALNMLRRDENVRMVLLTSTGSTFCQGIDLTALQHPNHDTRKKNAENLAKGIKEFLRALVQFPKIIVAGVNGNAMGLGVTMLPLFDMVIANDKAEFFLPYAKLGQVPEGGATYTFPNYYGKLQSTRLFLGQKITASQAQQLGLVSEAIWPATFYQELLPKVALLASQSPQSMEGTKALMNHHIITKLELSVESECRILLQQWTTQNFVHLSKRFLDTSEIQFQKPVNLPL